MRCLLFCSFFAATPYLLLSHEVLSSRFPPFQGEVLKETLQCIGAFGVQVSIGNSAHLFSALGIDNSWSHKKFQRDLRVAMKWVKGNDMEFDIIGIDPAIANALRRILIAEIPTVAIEHVYMVQNTSIIAVRPPLNPCST